MIPFILALTGCAVFDYHFGVGMPMGAGVLTRNPSTDGSVDYDAPATLYAGISWSPSTNKNHRESMEQRERHALMRLGSERYGSHGDITVTVDAEGGYTATEIEAEIAPVVDTSVMTEVDANTSLDLPINIQNATEAAFDDDAPEAEDDHIVTTITETIPVDWSGGVGTFLWALGACLILLTLKHVGFFRWLFNKKKREDADG